MRWWPRKNRDEDLARELQGDLQLEEEKKRERGLSPEDARFAAVRAFGNPTVIREQTRAVWTWNWLERLLRNLKNGVRTVWGSPWFSSVSGVVLGGGRRRYRHTHLAVPRCASCASAAPAVSRSRQAGDALRSFSPRRTRGWV